MNRLYFIRHGENYANLTKEFSYRKVDYSLTPKGQLQAEQTAQTFANLHVDAIFSSPLKRAYETAEAIARVVHLPIQVMEAFREVNVGELEGQPPTIENWRLHNQIVEGWLDGRPERQFVGGENWLELISRVRAGLIEVLRARDDQNIVISAHGGVIFFGVIGLLNEQDRLSISGKILDNCSITQVDAELQGEELILHLIRYNDTSHLSGEAANLVNGVPQDADFQPTTKPV